MRVQHKIPFKLYSDKFTFILSGIRGIFLWILRQNYVLDPQAEMLIFRRDPQKAVIKLIFVVTSCQLSTSNNLQATQFSPNIQSLTRHWCSFKNPKYLGHERSPPIRCSVSSPSDTSFAPISRPREVAEAPPKRREAPPCRSLIVLPQSNSIAVMRLY